MATTNPITGDTIATRVVSEAYRDNYDAIFGKKKAVEELSKVGYEADTDVSDMLANNTGGFFDKDKYPSDQLETQSPFNTINS